MHGFGESGAYGEYSAYISALGETNSREHDRLLRSLRREHGGRRQQRGSRRFSGFHAGAGAAETAAPLVIGPGVFRRARPPSQRTST